MVETSQSSQHEALRQPQPEQNQAERQAGGHTGLGGLGKKLFEAFRKTPAQETPSETENRAVSERLNKFLATPANTDTRNIREIRQEQAQKTAEVQTSQQEPASERLRQIDANIASLQGNIRIGGKATPHDNLLLDNLQKQRQSELDKLTQR